MDRQYLRYVFTFVAEAINAKIFLFILNPLDIFLLNFKSVSSNGSVKNNIYYYMASSASGQDESNPAL